MGGSSSVQSKASKPQQQIAEALQQKIAALEAEKRQLEENLKERDDALAKLQEKADTSETVSAAESPNAAADIPADDKCEWKAITIVVLGATGDLAKKKTFPALFALYRNGHLPAHFRVVGYGRTKWEQGDMTKMLEGCLGDVPERAAFAARCSYCSGGYDSDEHLAALAAHCRALEEEASIECDNRRQYGPCANRLYYFAIPPFAYAGAAGAIRRQGKSSTGWTRMIIEKPFGRDLSSYTALAAALAAELSEDELYRIDHYLGKELAQTMTAFRFANEVWEPLWCRAHVSCVHITFQEDIGTQGRGGYFDQYGIIRDVIQNHLIQLLALVAMEQPASLHANDIRNRKVEVLKCIEPVKMENVVVGQYTSSPDGSQGGYKDDKTVPEGSLTPTYAAMVLFINNPRWHGVPFILTGGKALNKKLVDIRLQFHPPVGGLFSNHTSNRNELVMRVQPNEAIMLRIITKEPGLASAADAAAEAGGGGGGGGGGDGTADDDHGVRPGRQVVAELDLNYKTHFPAAAAQLPDAYERLILDALRGDKSLFVRDDELAASWAIFTPILQQLEEGKVVPDPYPFGSTGPAAAAELLHRFGYVDTP